MKKNIYKFLNLLSYLFFLYVLKQIDINFLKDYKFLIETNLSKIFLSILILICSNLFIGLTWSIYINRLFLIDYKISFFQWLNSYKAKYVPGKVTAPVLRISDPIYSGKKKDLFFSIFLENIYLVFSNIFLGAYVIFKSLYSFEIHLLLYFFINFLIYILGSTKIFNFSLVYLKYSFFLQISNLFLLISIYLFLTTLNVSNAFYTALLYLLVSGLGMLVSVVPASIGIREYGVIEVSKLLKLNIFSAEFIVVAIRVLLLVSDLFIILLSELVRLNKR